MRTPFATVLLTLLLLASLGHAQIKTDPQDAAERRQLRQALKYQRSSKHDLAIRILEPLYRADPANSQYYQELLESYLYMQQLEAARFLVNAQRQRNPDNIGYEIDFGTVLYKSENPDSADLVWKGLLAAQRDNVEAFTLVANAMRFNRLYDEAAEVYKQGYLAHSDKHYLLNDIAALYKSRLQYGDALDYFIQFLVKMPERRDLVSRQVLSFRAEDEEADSLVKQMTEIAAKYRRNKDVQYVAAKLYQKYHHYEQAIEIYRELDDSRDRGKLLLEFAGAVQADSLYELALEGYNEIIKRYPDSQYLLRAYLGAAECNLAVARKSDDAGYAKKALDIIHAVKKEYPASGYLASLSLLEGDIYRHFFFDIDKAITIYRTLTETFREDVRIVESAKLKAAECYIILGKLDNAREILDSIGGKENRALAMLHLAQLDYYESRYDSASARLSQLIAIQGVGGTVTNDALQMQSILANQQTSPEALAHYARADWLLFQEKKSEAISKLESALNAMPAAPFRIRILLEAARLAAEIDRTGEAIGFCEQILNDEELLLYADQALFIMATISDRQIDDPAGAFQLYDRILADYPRTQYASTVRKRMQRIRREHPDIFQ